jgi:hypothetical protein
MVEINSEIGFATWQLASPIRLALLALSGQGQDH